MSMPGKNVDRGLEYLLHKDAIADCLRRYARGIDRLDRTLLDTVYWPEATDNHLGYVGSMASFVEFAIDYPKNMTTQHFLGQSLIEFDSPTSARCETYSVAAHERPAASENQDFPVRGRFLDRFERRGDEWRISQRFLTCDLYSLSPATADWKEGPFASIPHSIGQKAPSDLLYNIFDLSGSPGGS